MSIKIEFGKAAEEAIKRWLEEVELKGEKVIDPVKNIRGLIKNVDIDSVTLRHEVTKLWIKKGFE